ncbi:hypothetical protein SAMN02745244_00849 [Tessaracoccus bendigoensis DSM 12906]|uniref:Uncharacterized protein n=1 Tax=Tessaracoccus bendigoensis DSM 12906 TaxID=1123357 RepID=A0A1M6D5G6_9ACTN|nr:hypothetical protein SAMN02745244_00849 [Tessaracoccus bendigoensis DSM 12906]
MTPSDPTLPTRFWKPSATRTAFELTSRLNGAATADETTVMVGLVGLGSLGCAMAGEATSMETAARAAIP